MLFLFLTLTKSIIKDYYRLKYMNYRKDFLNKSKGLKSVKYLAVKFPITHRKKRMNHLLFTPFHTILFFHQFF